MNPLAILTAASAIGLVSAVAYAQPAPPAQPERHPMTSADMASLTDARIAGIQAGLKLTPDQQKLWPPVEQALRAQSAQRAKVVEEFRARNKSERPDLMTMMDRHSANLTQEAETLRNLTTAMKPFWASLDDRQKKLLPVLMHPVASGRMMRMRHERGMMEHGGMGKGMGPGSKAPAPQQ
ncbi:Spy/CpxP family protein refolding chaperone [Microvirga sp. 2MCAF38]|uniref:Spy/CpxP family protein refolding chaperone n=1 Tax=Microvirga sp. 2MCAF38 TaxID=3232989 RepID=UPI003F9C5C03